VIGAEDDDHRADHHECEYDPGPHRKAPLDDNAPGKIQSAFACDRVNSQIAILIIERDMPGWSDEEKLPIGSQITKVEILPEQIHCLLVQQQKSPLRRLCSAGPSWPRRDSSPRNLRRNG